MSNFEIVYITLVAVMVVIALIKMFLDKNNRP